MAEYANPTEIVGYGPTVDLKVFKISFHEDISSRPKLEAYDNDQTFPATGAANATTFPIFQGSAAGTMYPMIALFDTTATVPTSTTWLGTAPNGTPIAGGTYPFNRLKGTVNYVLCGTIPKGSAGSIWFNMRAEIPCDINPTIDATFDLVCRYTYTGTAPNPSWWINESTEAAPIWIRLVSGTHGIRHCKSGTAKAGPYLANIPDCALASTEKTIEAFVTE